MRRDESVTINGITKTFEEWCEHTGADFKLANARYEDLNWPVAQAIGLEPRVLGKSARKSRFNGQRDVKIEHLGQSHTLKEWIQILALPLSYRTLVYRYNQGYEPKDILDPRKHTRDVLRQKNIVKRRGRWERGVFRTWDSSDI